MLETNLLANFWASRYQDSILSSGHWISRLNISAVFTSSLVVTVYEKLAYRQDTTALSSEAWTPVHHGANRPEKTQIALLTLTQKPVSPT